MEYGEPPSKKRRFFVEDSPELNRTLNREPSSSNSRRFGQELKTDSEAHRNHEREATGNATLSNGEPGFDSEVFSAFVGEIVSKETLVKLAEVSGNNMERAINMYLDGSWSVAPRTMHPQIRTKPNLAFKPDVAKPDPVPERRRDVLADTPTSRYVGAFGVTGWATTSGTGLISPEEKITIERAKPQLPRGLGRGGKPRNNANKKQDIVVRFTNSKDQEVGRLENESAAWISTLLDQKVCRFDAACIFAPDRLRTNDNIYLQLRCYLLKSAFDPRGFVKPEDNRETGLFEAKESDDERKLRLRQVALVKLFDEINLHPSKVNATTEKHKRQNLLQAAETADAKEQNGNASPKNRDSGDPGSSPPSEDAEDGQELEQDQLDSLYKKAQSFDFDTPEAEPASTFAMKLRKYQRQALHWMLGKEKDQKSDRKEQSMHPLWEEYQWPTNDVDGKDLPDVKDQSKFYVNPYSGEMSIEFPVQEQNCLGGILADEMGLGKTIEMMSLIHSHRANIDVPMNGIESSMALPRLPKDSASVVSAPCTTLVVAPMSLLAQWQSEAEKASTDGSMKVLMYYGNEKGANLQHLCCEGNAANAPNVIITSYGTILSEFNAVAANNGNRGSHGGLFSVEYFRIILDEAHFIKNRQSKTAKACYQLSAVHRWVLTGTPIVNRLEDLFSLVHFLRVEPWSNFSFWKTFITVPFESKDFIGALDVVQTVLEPLVLRRTKDMKTPSGEALVPLPPKVIDVEKVELSEEERGVYDFIFMRAKRTFAANVEAGTLMKSYTTIFAQILRLRQSCCHPILTRNKNIVAEEEDAAAAADIANGLSDDMDLQALIERFTASEEETDSNKYGAHVLKQIQAEAKDECPICSEEPMEEQAVTGCWHSACKKCLLDYIEHQRNKGEVPRCFNCREPVSARDVFEVIRHDPEPSASTSTSTPDLYSTNSPGGSPTPQISLRRINAAGSAKIRALLTHLLRTRRNDPNCKSVIFSQFTSFLDILEPALTRDRIPFLRFDGSMAQKARAVVLKDFAERATGCVLLLSLRAGGVGLNLTCAKQVFMMDPWWSFAVEAQAIDRVHRMGQESGVKVVRFIAAESIEEKMLRIQDRKKFIASSLGMMSDEEKKLQRIEDIKELLS